MTIGGLIITKPRMESTSFTHPHLALEMNFAAPVGLPYSSIERIVMPFSGTVWLCILFATAFIVQYLYLCRSLSRVKNDNFSAIFEAIHLTLGISQTEKVLRVINRSGLTVWLLATLVLRNIYSCALFDLLQAQVNERAVDTIDRIIETNYKVYSSPATFDFLLQHVPKLKKQLMPFPSSTGALPTTKEEMDGIVFTTTRASIDYYNKISRGQLNELIPIANENIWFVLLTIYLEEQSGLQENINDGIGRFIAHGFLAKWMSDYGIMVDMRKKKDKHTQQLTLKQMIGVFIICGGLYAVATIIFVFEYFSGKGLKHLPAHGRGDAVLN